MAVAGGAIFALTGNPWAAAAPALLTTVAYGLWTIPLRHLIFGLLFLVLGVFAPPPDVASGGIWSVLQPVHGFLFVYLSRLTGIDALALKGIEAIYLLLPLLVAARSFGRRPAGNPTVPSVRNVDVLFIFCGLAFLGVVWLEAWGVATGGDFRSTFFQVHELVWLPLLTCIVSYALRDARDFARFVPLVTAAAAIKILLGSFYLISEVWPRHLWSEFMTSHQDTVLFVVVLFVWCAMWLHRPRARTVLPTLVVCGWLLVGLILNNRRIAYVSLLACFLLLYLLLKGPVKRWLTKAFIFALPVLGLYLFLARSHSTGIFKPGAAIVSVSQQKDASSVWREIENVNLLATLSNGKLFGSGWGHEYIEVVKADDISRYMPQYRFVPHNSVLWLLGAGGIIGFTVLWMPIVIGVFLAGRSYRFARNAYERTAAAGALAVFIAFVNQAWGDMGMQGDGPILLLACALAVSGKLARITGAWPSGVRLIAPPTRAPFRERSALPSSQPEGVLP